MPEIEWLDGSDPAAPDELAVPAGGAPEPSGNGVEPPVASATGSVWSRSPLAVILSAVLWVVSAALAVYASFGTVYLVDFGVSALPDASVDGWGRFSRTATVVPGAHGARYGIALCVAAAALLVAAVGALLDMRRPRDDLTVYRAARSTGLAATATLIGVLGAAALAAQGQIDSVRSSLRLEGLDTADHAASTTSTELHYGSLLRLGGAAVLCAVLALVVPLILSTATARGRRRPTSSASAESLIAPDIHPDDEALASGAGHPAS